MDETIIITSKLLLALLIPLIGSIFVMLLGKDENLRETISSVSSIALFVVVCSMIPTIFAGQTLGALARQLFRRSLHRRLAVF